MQAEIDEGATVNCLNKWIVIHTTHYTQSSTEHRHVAEIERCLKQTIHPAEDKTTFINEMESVFASSMIITT